jgi:hypothetical protein
MRKGKKRGDGTVTDEETTMKQGKSSSSSENTQRSKRSKISNNIDGVDNNADFSIPLTGTEITLTMPANTNNESMNNKESNGKNKDHEQSHQSDQLRQKSVTQIHETHKTSRIDEKTMIMTNYEKNNTTNSKESQQKNFEPRSNTKENETKTSDGKC